MLPPFRVYVTPMAAEDIWSEKSLFLDYQYTSPKAERASAPTPNDGWAEAPTGEGEA